MTNYERIQKDKAFCASVLFRAEEGSYWFEEAMQWLDTEQIEVSGERTQEVNHE